MVVASSGSIRVAAQVLPLAEGLVLDGQPVGWGEMRSVSVFTWMPMPSADEDFLVIQAVGGVQHWVKVCGWCDDREWRARTWNDQTIARLEAWWLDALEGLDPAPTSIPFGRPAMRGLVLWPPEHRGQPLYELRSRRLLGLLPWGEELVLLLPDEAPGGGSSAG